MPPPASVDVDQVGVDAGAQLFLGESEDDLANLDVGGPDATEDLGSVGGVDEAHRRDPGDRVLPGQPVIVSTTR